MSRARLAAAVLAAAAVAGCGGGGESGSPPSASSRSDGAQPVGRLSAGSPVTFANCGDWRGASRAERYATIEALRGRLTPELSKTAASPLPDERAYEVFQNTCAQGIDSLRLYKLYVRVQGFAPLMD